MLGQMGTNMNAAFAALEATSQYKAASNRVKSVLHLATTFDEAEKYLFGVDSPDNLLWLGSPSLTAQLLLALQRAARAKQPTLPVLPLQQEVLVVATIKDLAVRMKSTLRRFMVGETIDVGSMNDLQTSLARVRTAAVVQDLQWSTMLAAAKAQNIDEMLEQVKQAERSSAPQLQTPHPPQQAMQPNVQQPQQVVITMPKAGAHSLSDDELRELDRALIGGSSRTITLQQAKILVKAGGTQLQALQPACRDLNNIGLPDSLVEYCKTTASANFTEHDVRRVP